MPYVVFDEKMHVYACETIDDISAPTTGEIAAGVDVTGQTRKDGVKFGTTNNRVQAGDLSTRFAAELMGTWGAALELMFKRRDDADVAWTTFTHLWAGFIVVCPFGEAADGEEAYVFPVEAGQRQPADSAENEQQSFTVPFAVTSAPDLDAVVTEGS